MEDRLEKDYVEEIRQDMDRNRGIRKFNSVFCFELIKNIHYSNLALKDDEAW